MKSLIKWLFLLAIVKEIAWVLFIPLWHFPDEQAHFGHVAFLAEGGELPLGKGKNLNEEIATSEQLLGTYLNKYGNSLFTFHPEYRLEYTGNFTGKYEQEIMALPQSMRKNYVAVESAYYPHFFYRVSETVYRLFYNQNIFIRTFAIRLFWVPAYLLLVWFGYQIARLVFQKDQSAVISTTILIGFQPMLSFVSAGITSDNLHNLLFTALIYFCLKLLRQVRWQEFFCLAITLALGVISKPQFFIALAIVTPVTLIVAVRRKKLRLIIVSALGFLTLAVFSDQHYFQELGSTLAAGKIPFWDGAANPARPDYTLWQHLVYTSQHTFREVLPWYWGVFRWLSLTLPRWVNQVMMRLLLAAGIGLVIKFLRRKFESGFWLILWSALVYFLALFFWDFQHIRNAGFPFGVQGRYYFPVIVPHMILLVMGIKVIWSKLLLILDYWFIALNWIAFYWVTASYFDVTNFKTFIIQASQYKPDFAKGWYLVAVLGLYFILTLVFSVRLFKGFRHEK